VFLWDAKAETYKMERADITIFEGSVKDMEKETLQSKS